MQAHADSHGSEVSAQDLWQLFDTSYLQAAHGPLHFSGTSYSMPAAKPEPGQGVRLDLQWQGARPWQWPPLAMVRSDAAVQALGALGIQVQVHSFEERSTQASSAGGNAQACAFIELVSPDGVGTCFGVGLDNGIR